jgi:DNA-binding NarL/FixJ family response regulator
MKKILLIDDHTLFREGVQLLLKQLDDRVEVLSAGTCKIGLELAASHTDVDLVLLDLELPDQSRFEGLDTFRERQPGLPVVMMSARDDSVTVVEALDHGAMGFIPKTSSTELMLNALRLVFAGGTYIPPEAISGHGSVTAPITLESASANRPRRALADLGLTTRQVDVLRLLVKGRSNKLICRELDLAEGTVKTHMTAVLRALHVTNRTQAIIAIAKSGIIIEPPKAMA